MTTSPTDRDRVLALDREAVSAPPLSPFRGARITMEWTNAPDPAWQRILDEHAGLNFYGGPNLRILWASSRLVLAGGVWNNTEEEDAGLPSVRYQWIEKYPWLEGHWIVEEWKPPTLYGSRATWEESQRRWEDGISYLEHPIFPERGDYEYLTYFRRKLAGGLEAPESPTSTGLRVLASLWLRAKHRRPPTVRDLERRAREAKDRKDLEAKRKRKDIWDNEVGGLTGFKPTVSLAGLDVPPAG